MSNYEKIWGETTLNKIADRIEGGPPPMEVNYQIAQAYWGEAQKMGVMGG